MYVLFEGIDTCGKSTQIEYLRNSHPDFIYTREPGGTAFGRDARRMLLDGTVQSERAEILLFLTDRAEHYDEVVAPNRGGWIFSDRGLISGMAYAMASSRFDFETLARFNSFALNGDLPDRVILLLLDRETLTHRLSSKSEDAIERRGIEYLLRVQESMRECVERLSVETLFIDASLPPSEINKTILNYLKI